MRDCRRFPAPAVDNKKTRERSAIVLASVPALFAGFGLSNGSIPDSAPFAVAFRRKRVALTFTTTHGAESEIENVCGAGTA